MKIDIIKIMIQDLSTDGFYSEQWPYKEIWKNTENYGRVGLFLQSITLRGHNSIRITQDWLIVIWDTISSDNSFHLPEPLFYKIFHLLGDEFLSYRWINFLHKTLNILTSDYDDRTFLSGLYKELYIVTKLAYQCYNINYAKKLIVWRGKSRRITV